MALSESTIEEVRQVSILDIAYALGDPVKRKGSSYNVPCPNSGHSERTPDTYISPSKGVWKCFGGGSCGAKGRDAITYYAWHEFGAWEPKTHFVDSVIGIAELMGIDVTYEGKSYSNENHKSTQKRTKRAPIFEEVEAADPDTCDKVYRKFLELCPINKEHAEEWLGPKRQYTKEQVLNIGLRSVPASFDDMSAIINNMLEQGFSFDRVPGFTKRLKQSGEQENEQDWYWTINAKEGYFIPVRDSSGRIVRLRIATNSRNKYIWFSSNPTVYVKGGKYHFYDPKLEEKVQIEKKYRFLMSRGGAPSGAPINVVPPPRVLPLWEPGDEVTYHCKMDYVIVTEGEHKSNISSTKLNMPVIGVPGVGNWREVVSIVKKWETKKIAIAYDMDALKSEEKANGKNQQVFDHLVEFAKEMMQHGIEVVLWTWNISDGKGLDDVLLNGKYPTEIDLRTKERRPVKVS